MLRVAYFVLGAVFVSSLVLALLTAPFHAARIRLSENDHRLWRERPMRGLVVAWRLWRGSWTQRFILTAVMSWIALVLLSLVCGKA